MTPEQALDRLLAGNDRFVSGTLLHPGRSAERRSEQAEVQTPFAIILGCADSRVPPEIVFDEGIGDLFPVRIAGNTAADDVVMGSIEYAVAVLNCVLVLVLGHEQCGAVKAAIELVANGQQVPGHIDGVVRPVVPAVKALKAVPAEQLLDAAVKENVRRTVTRLASSTPVLADRVREGQLKVVGAEYGMHSGKVTLVT